MNNLPLVAVSACLLGHAVRYDGKDKYTCLIAEELKKYCQLLPICPELEIGLGVPRSKIQLTQVGQTVKVLKQDDPNTDLAEPLKIFATQFASQHSLAGLVLQDRSPSCGVKNTQVYSLEGKVIGVGSGLFAATMLEIAPDLVMVQASQLSNKQAISWFVKKLTLKNT
ncbi:MAG: DUF523 domain-containing protein [Methylococcales bacterium]